VSNDNEIPLEPALLSRSGIQDSGQAQKNLDLMGRRLGMQALAAVLPHLLTSLKRAGDPDMALNNLERFLAEFEPVSQFTEDVRDRPAVLGALLVLFGASRFLAAWSIATANETYRFLRHPDFLAHPADKEHLADRLSAALQGVTREEDLFRALRQYRKREMLRIGLRDLVGRADLTETVTELSNLAEVCLQAAYTWYNAELRARFGAPVILNKDGTVWPAGFAVIGMGKLGGGELNFSSDIDLMYVYTADGETEGVPAADGTPGNRISNHQYFIKLAEKLSAAIGQSTDDGFVFRVDLRLRPEGQRGPLAQSLGGYEIYYESWGQTWERSALIKARPVAGDEAVGREFLARVAPFVYRKYLDFGAIVEIREMKQKINREVAQKGKTHRDVKLGYGGIREIEFLIQSLQLIYGGRDRGLRERNSLIALHTLAQKGLLTYQENAVLSKAYAFLRTVEHRIQILDDRQTQTLPSGDAELRSLARRTGYVEQGREAEALLHDYANHTRRVRGIYDDLLSQPDQAKEDDRPRSEFSEMLGPEISEQETVGLLARYGFRDPTRAYRNIVMLREGQAFVHQTPRSRRVFNEMFPLLFEEIVRSPDPDMALNYFESYLASQGSWDAFQAFMRQDVRALKVLISVFGNSEYFSRMMVRSPALIEDLLDASREIGLGSTAFLEQGLTAALAKAATITDKLDALRRFKHREELRIGMADLMGAIPLQAVCRSLSRLADACLGAALDLAVSENAKRCGIDGGCGGLVVIGAGKLGGRELIYGSDLDILFVYDEARAAAPPPGISVFEYFSKLAEKTIAYLTTMTREGFAYRVDTRLRPTGSKGPLVQSIAAFRSYYDSHAETWERQALVNSRAVAGDLGVGRVFKDALQQLIYRDADPAALAADIRSMRKRMQDERGREDVTQYNIKQGVGGLVDIEFLAQYLQLRHGMEMPWVRVPGTVNALHALRKVGVLSPTDHQALCRAYLFLRRLESRLRIVANQSTSFLSRDPAKLRTLAKRMGYGDEDGSAGKKLLAEYERTSREMRGMFERFVGE
jgi:glutamate-ammonia-ligase adenylyltransferase